MQGTAHIHYILYPRPKLKSDTTHRTLSATPADHVPQGPSFPSQLLLPHMAMIMAPQTYIIVLLREPKRSGRAIPSRHIGTAVLCMRVWIVDCGLSAR